MDSALADGQSRKGSISLCFKIYPGGGLAMRPEGSKPNFRCAIYTRVSTEQGLEQEFNSLDNQREAGGSMERPALQSSLMTFALAGSTWSSSIRSTG